MGTLRLLLVQRRHAATLLRGGVAPTSRVWPCAQCKRVSTSSTQGAAPGRVWEQLGVHSGGSLLVDLPSSAVNLTIQSEWSDQCKVALLQQHPQGTNTAAGSTITAHSLTVQADVAAQTVRIADSGDGATHARTLHVSVPEMFSVSARLGSGAITVAGKLKGDVRLHIACGSGGDCGAAMITAGTIKGEVVELVAGGDGSSVRADNLEGGISISAARVDVRLMLSTNAAVAAREAATIGGLYATHARVDCEGGEVSVGNSHGRIVVGGAPWHVALAGVSGSAAVRAAGDVQVNFDAVEQGSVSEVASSGGSVSVSTPDDTRASVAIAAATVQVKTQAFQGTASATAASGTLVPSASAASAASRGGGGSGKIDLRGAREQRLRSFGGASERDGAAQQQQRGGGPAAGAAAGAAAVTSELHLSAPHGTALLETLGWMDRIKRRHGF